MYECIVPRCSNGKSLRMKDALVSIQVKSSRNEYDVKLEGERQMFASRQDLENGIEPFKDLSVIKSIISSSSSAEGSSSEEDEDNASQESAVDAPRFSKCQIRISPERNLMTPGQNNEKVMFLQNLLDEFAFKFDESIDTVLISGEQSVANYETFLRRLTYVILNLADVEATKLSLIKTKKFLVTCTRVETGLDTNTVVVQVSCLLRAFSTFL